MKTFLSILLVVLILGVVLLLFVSDQMNRNDDNTDNATTTEDSLNDTDVKVFRTTVAGDFRFEMEYPESTTVSKVNDTVIEHMYIGPDSEPNTEITDGYYATIEFTEASDLRTYADDQQATSEIQTTTFAGHEALTFTTTSELGSEMTRIVYRPIDALETIVDISYTIEGNNISQYQERLLSALNSISITVIGDSTQNEGTQIIQIAMLDYEGLGEESNGKERGCDRVVMIEEIIPTTDTPLNASLNILFSYEDTTVQGWNNFMAKTNDTLMFDRATLEDGVASIYLTGELSGLAGVCDNPRAKIQIEETALQFSTVNAVRIFLNGEETELQPSPRGS